jgi:hypothetical protein
MKEKMKRKTMLWKSLSAFVLGSVALTSCLDDPEPAALDAAPDVFIQKIVEDGEGKYALAFWTLANKNLQSVTVKGPDDETFTLDENANKTVFSLLPETEDYVDSLPADGNYEFTITSTQTGEAPLKITDKLEDDTLGTLVIDTVGFNNNKLKIEWESLDDADGYFVRLYDESDELIYASANIDDNKTDFSFGLTDQGWIDSANKAEDGENYRLELLSILYESTATTSNQDYNIQFVSIASATVVWEE